MNQKATTTKKITVRHIGTDSNVYHDSSLEAHQVRLATYSVPEVTDKDTVINLATMSSDAYFLNASNTGWHNLTQGFNDSFPFGYNSDGLRGHVFANVDNSTVIVAFKGTSIVFLEETRAQDRLNDNLLFSCCCAAQRPLPFWYGEVCSCKEGVYQCNSTCLTSELLQKDRYYAAASSVVANVTRDLFPSAAVWTTGHSLGGSLASLTALRFGLPAVTFEAPPDRLAARRLGLVPPTSQSIKLFAPPAYHFGHSADPVYMGACQGFLSTCAAAGYSFESQCFTGKRCIYDTMGDKGWRSNIVNHRIDTVITSVLKAYDKVPECLDEDDECADCFNWTFD